MYFLHYTLHTQLYKSQKYVESQQLIYWPSSDCLVQWLPNNIYIYTYIYKINYMHTQNYACADALPEDTLAWMPYFTQQANRCSPLSMHWCPIRRTLPINALLHTSQLYGCSPQCMCVCFIRVLLSLNALLHTSQT